MEIRNSNCSTNFNGFTHIMSKGVYNSDKFIKDAAASYPKSDSFAGNFPSEMIHLMKAKSATGNIAKEVCDLKTAFAKTAKTLRQSAENGIAELAKENLAKKEAEIFMAELCNESTKLREMSIVSLECAKSAFGQQFDKNAQEYSKELKEVCVRTGILPKDGDLKISFLGAGSFGNAFQLSFLDKNENKIFHDKVLKVYHSEDTKNNPFKFSAEYILDRVKNISEKEYCDIILQDIPYTPVNSSYLENISRHFSEIQNLKPNDYKYIESTTASFAKDFHGCAPEANAALFLKSVTGGSMDKTNFITPYAFDLKNQYAIMDMSDAELAVKKKIDPLNYGICSYDMHEGNNINDKVVDYGGFKVLDKKLASDKTYRYQVKINNKNKQKNNQSVFSRFQNYLASMF